MTAEARGRREQHELDALNSRRGQATSDLVELDAKVADGRIDEDTAAGLRDVYVAELVAVARELGGVDLSGGGQTTAAGETGRSAAGGMWPSRRIALVAGVLIALVTLQITVGSRDLSLPESVGPVPLDSGALGEGPIDLSSVTRQDLEAAVASMPEANGVRLALADQLLESGDQQTALEHYLAVVVNDPSPKDHSRALGRIGYLAYVTDQPDAAIDYLNEALDVDPGNNEARLFMGMALWYGLGDGESAAPFFEEVLGVTDLPDELRDYVANALREARDE